jgi:hypothetical protein
MLAAGETITRLRATATTDAYGEQLDWSTADSEEIAGCGFAPRQEDEADAAGRAGVIVGYTLYAPFDADILFGDRVETPYGLFEIEGEPGKWRNPYTGGTPGLTAALRRVVG